MKDCAKYITCILILFAHCALLSGSGLLPHRASNVLSLCYEVVHSHNGLENVLYTTDLDSTACEVKSLFQSVGVSSFDVVGHDYYPFLSNVSSNYNFDVTYRNELRDEEENRQSFILIAKDHLENGQLAYRVKLKLLDADIFDELTPMDVATIERNIEEHIYQEAIRLGGSLPQNNTSAEIAGLELLKIYIGQIASGNLQLENTWSQAGFDVMPVDPNEEVRRSIGGGPAGLQSFGRNEYFDLAGLEIEHGGESDDLISTLRHGFEENMGPDSVFGFVSHLIIVTDDLNSASELRDAENAFSATDKKFILWLHHSADTMRIKRGNTLSVPETTILLDYYFEDVVRKSYSDRFNGQGSAFREEDDQIHLKSSGSCTELSWEYGKNCLLPLAESYVPTDFPTERIKAGITIGVLDGLLGTLKLMYDSADGAFKKAKGLFSWYAAYSVELGEHVRKNQSIWSGFQKIWDDGSTAAKEKWKELVTNFELLKDAFQNVTWAVIQPLIDKAGNAIKNWIGDLIEGEPGPGYDIGIIVFEVILGVFSGGGSAAAKFGAKVGAKVLPKIISLLRKLKLNKGADLADELFGILSKSTKLNPDGTPENPGAFWKAIKCKILGGGCFVKDTPVLMASSSNAYNLKQIAFGGLLLAASAPIAAVPIQEVQLLDYAVAHTSINNQDVLGEAIAGTDEYFGTSKESRQYLDPYTSPQQRQRDEYQIDSLNWYAVTFSENMGASTAQLALHRDWIEERGYKENATVELNLPEQGISGPFTITAIRHILPQKIPVDTDPSDDYAYRPVTALFTHVSNQVYEITFGDSTHLDVTYRHPIYSVTAGDWRLAGVLKPGEEVMTRTGTEKVVSILPRNGKKKVYNLEVKEWHNFLVGKSGIVVHNGCWSSRLQKYGRGAAARYQKAIDHVWEGHNPLSRISGKSFFKGSLNDKIKLKKYITEAQSKGSILNDVTNDRTVDGVVRTYRTIVRDMGENVGKLRDHSTDTNILTSIFDITDGNPIINNVFPGHP